MKRQEGKEKRLYSKQKRQDRSRRVWIASRRGIIASGESEQKAEEASCSRRVCTASGRGRIAAGEAVQKCEEAGKQAEEAG